MNKFSLKKIRFFDFDLWATKEAVENFKSWHISKEYRVLILILIVGKRVTQIFSIYAAYYFLFTYINNSLNNLVVSVVFTLFFLALIEVLTAVFISKFSKFMLKGQFKTMVVFAFLMVVMFSVSFYTSTEGLEMRAVADVLVTDSITLKYKQEQETVIAQYNERIAHYKQQIETVESNPQGWKDGKRCILVKEQLEKIDEYTTKIEQLNNELEQQKEKLNQTKLTEIETNKTESQQTGNENYWFAVAVMFFSFVVNVGLMIIDSLIYKEKRPADFDNEQTNFLISTIKNFVKTVVTDEVSEEVQHLQKGIIHASTRTQTQSEVPVPAPEKNNVKNPIGFTANFKENHKENFKENSKNTDFKASLKSDFSQDFKESFNENIKDFEDFKEYNENRQKFLKRYESIVNHIINKQKTGYTFAKIASLTGVSEATVYNVKRIIDNT